MKNLLEDPRAFVKLPMKMLGDIPFKGKKCLKIVKQNITSSRRRFLSISVV